MPRKNIDLRKFVSEELVAKYDFFEKKDFPTTSNMSVDSFFPKLFNIKTLGSVPTTTQMKFNTSSFAISEFVANTLSVRKAHISELCDILGYSEAAIKRILIDVKRKRLNLFLVGFGGTGANFNYWLKELNSWTNTVNIFNTITVNDNDSFSLSNLPRIPFDFRTNHSMPTKRIHFDNSSHLANRIEPLAGENAAVSAAKGAGSYVFYGAPDLATRKELSEMKDTIFISATHAGDECQLYLNPPQDDDVQIETYGKINLSVFFMNHLKMTIEFLSMLTNSDDINWNLSGEIMSYDFKKEYNASVETGEQMGTGRLYRFPCMTREELEANREANNAERAAEQATETDIPPVPEPDEGWEEVRAAGTQNDGLQTETTFGSWDSIDDSVLDDIIAGVVTPETVAQETTGTGAP